MLTYIIVMKKTKVIVKKKKEVSKRQPRQKQKQRQNVNVNVHIDQSKRTTPRKPKADKPSNQYPPAVFYQPPPPPPQQPQQPPPPPPPPQIYGLAPVSNTSDSFSSVISKEENAKRFENIIEQRSIQPSLFNLNPVNSMSNALGESIRKEETKREFTAPRVQKIPIETVYENTNDTYDDIQNDDEQLGEENDDEQSVEQNNIIQLDEPKNDIQVLPSGGGGGGVVSNPTELTQRQINLSQNNVDRKAARKLYTPMDLKRMNLGELQALATNLKIPLENQNAGSGTGRGSKRQKTMAT